MAKEYTFDEIFDIAVAGIKAHVPDTQRAEKFCQKLQSQKLEVCERYSAIRDSVKTRYMKNLSEPLDRHKCVAAFMIALLHVLKLRDRNFSREDFAIFMGMLLLKIFIYKECSNIGDVRLLSLINMGGGLIFPPCVCDKNEYSRNWAIEMYCARKEGMLFLLALSNNLFMVEMYNRQLSKIEEIASATNQGDNEY